MKKFYFVYALVCCLSITIASCRGTDTTQTSTSSSSDSSTGSTPNTDSGEVSNTDGFKISSVGTDNFNYLIHKGTGAPTDNFSDECAVLSTSSDKDISCIIEARELDLFQFGAAVRVNVPQNLCEYVSVSRPYYYNFPPGNGPLIVIDNRLGSTDQTISGITAAAGTIKVGNDTKTSIYCDYDYGAEGNLNYVQGGPNCCVGNYEVYTTSDQNIVSTPVKSSWGGKVSNCLKGPAMQRDSFYTGLTSSGHPRSVIFPVLSSGMNEAYRILSPESLRLGSNVYTSNYFVSADHPNGGGRPVCTMSVNGFQATNLYHQFTCYDRASEVKARIRVMIREWNTDTEYNLGAAGDPDTGGSEPSFGNPANNDVGDMKDLGDTAPPSLSSYPKEVESEE